MLKAMTSLENLQILTIHTGTETNKLKIPNLSLNNLTTLNISCSGNPNNVDFKNLNEAIIKMPKLLNLTILESQHIFCREFANKIIETILARNLSVVIKPNLQKGYFSSRIKQIVISPENDVLKLKKFSLTVDSDCLKNLDSDDDD